MPHPGQSKCIELLKYIGIGMLLATYASLPATSHGDQSSIEISNPNLMGINIASPLDWEEDRLYADVIRMSRDFKAGADPNSRNLAAVDEEGWPVADFSFYVWAGIGKMHGTYTLSFKGQARVLANPGGNIPLSYDAASNTSSGKIRYTNSSPGALALIFTGTKRNNASASESGVTAIRLMRPLAPGASTSYPQTTLFNEPIKAIISKFSVIRFMDFLATNANQQKTWHERPLPSAPSFQRKVRLSGYGWQGSGGALEHAILLANETGKDAWINIPVLADDDFVLKVARMIAFGSDGINPYVSRQKNPVYPPLNPDLRVYVEYSNELWNSAGAFTQFHDNCQAASDELVAAAGNTPLNWDGIWNSVAYHQNGGNNSSWKWSMCSRRSAKRTVEISTIFRKVFGDAAMMTRVRPVMMSQLTYSSGMLFEETKMLFNYYNHMAGDFAGAPPAHPPSYYIYGAGGSGYYNPAKPLSNITSVDLLFNDAEMQAAGFAPELQADAHYTAALGVKRIAYEGGPNLETATGLNYTVTKAAFMDPRMQSTMIAMHNEWSADAGDLFVYYRATGDAQWGFTPDVYDHGTYKFAAIDTLNTMARAPVTLGMPFPGSLAGTASSACARSWGCNQNKFSASGEKPLIWASYSFRSSQAAPWSVSLSVNNASSNASVAVYIDGRLLGTKNTSGTAINFDAGAVDPGLHGVVVRAAAGSFSLTSVSVVQK